MRFLHPVISKVFTLALVLQRVGRSGRPRERRRGRDRAGLQLNRCHRAYKGAQENPFVNPGHHHHRHGQRHDGRREVDQDPEDPQRLRGPGPGGEQARLRERGGDESAQPGHRAVDVRLRADQGRPQDGHRRLYPPVRDQRLGQGPRDHGCDAGERRQDPSRRSRSCRSRTSRKSWR